MNTQPEALRLADQLGARYSGFPSCDEAATELRRLHAVNQELLEALKYHQEQTRPIERTRAAIAKAEAGMSRDDNIRMVREADPFGENGRLYQMAELAPGTLARFAALVAAAEREACVKVCITAAQKLEREGSPAPMARICAAAIRARGQS